MKPILFSKTATTFTTNGLGRLDAISCIVTEERNGMFELEMEVAEAAAHASEIEMSSIIVVKVPDKTNLQAFRVYRLTKPLNGIFKVFAQHISYQLSYIPCMPFTVAVSSSACNQALQGLKTNAVESCPFTFSTDVTTVAGYKQTTPASIKSRLGGVEGSVLDQFRGEYEWDNYTVYFKKNRGLTVPVVTLNYGKNITDINQEENIENTVTGIVPYWVSVEGDTVVTLPEKSVDSQYASAYPFKRTIPYDFSQSFEEAPTVLELRTKAQAYVNQTGLGIPDVSIKLSFVTLADTEEYKDIAALQTVKLCDTIQVYFEKLGINTTAKVVKYEYDVLSERYNSIEVGTIRRTLATTISGNMEEIEGVGDLTRDMVQKSTSALEDYADGAASSAETNAKNFATNAANTAQSNAKTYTDNQVATRPTSQQVATAINNATAWLTGSDGYVMAVKNNDGTWKELIFADHNDPADWVNVLRINENGIGFSSDGGQTYTQAWTLDGKLVIGGTNVPSLTVYDNAQPNPNILLQINSQGIIWNAPNSTLAQDGTFSTIYEDSSGKQIAYISEGEISFDYITRSGTALTFKPKIYPDSEGMGTYMAGNLSLRASSVTVRTNNFIIRPRDKVNGDDVNIYAFSASGANTKKVIIHTIEDLYFEGLRTYNTTGTHQAVNGEVYIGGVNYKVINGMLCYPS